MPGEATKKAATEGSSIVRVENNTDRDLWADLIRRTSRGDEPVFQDVEVPKHGGRGMSIPDCRASALAIRLRYERGGRIISEAWKDREGCLTRVLIHPSRSVTFYCEHGWCGGMPDE